MFQNGTKTARESVNGTESVQLKPKSLNGWHSANRRCCTKRSIIPAFRKIGQGLLALLFNYAGPTLMCYLCYRPIFQRKWAFLCADGAFKSGFQVRNHADMMHFRCQIERQMPAELCFFRHYDILRKLGFGKSLQKCL